MGAIKLVENIDRSQFIGYYQLKQYLCACLKRSKKQRDAGQSEIYMNQIESERVFMLMKMVQSRKVKYTKSTYKENITSVITHHQLIGEIQVTEEDLWERNKTCK